MADVASDIQYIRREAPPPPQSQCQGSRYETWMPATLDLAERAGLSVNGMVGPTDPDADYRVYWKVSFRFNPPVMYHDVSDTGTVAEFMESLPRMRMISGCEQGTDIEEHWKHVLCT